MRRGRRSRPVSRWAPSGSIRRSKSDDANIGKLKVVSLLESLPGVGKVKARKVMDEVGIAANRRIQGLGSVQRSALLNALG